MQKSILLLKRNYRKVKKYIDIKRGLSKPDTMSNIEICRVSDKPIVWLLGTEDFGNLGDHKIAIAIQLFLKRFFTDYDVIEVTARNYYAHCSEIEQCIRLDDIILGTGGGNFGNQYPKSQDIRKDFIKRFPHNKIVIMPQTMWYLFDENGKQELMEDVELFAQHDRVLLVLREKNSFQFAKQYFRNKCILAPDMALLEQPYSSGAVVSETKKKKVVLCLRKDLEGILDKRGHKHIASLLKREFDILKRIDTQRDYLISAEARVEETQEIIEEMASADLVVTDRLHGMVFAALAETPCIVFDNYNNKVKGIYDWIKELPYIRYKGMDIEIQKDIQELVEMKKKCRFHLPGMEEHFAELAETIRKY